MPIVFLLDSGASCNCLNEEIVTESSLRILPSKTKKSNGGWQIKLGNRTVPRVLRPDLLMSIKGGLEQFRCGTEDLESPLSGVPTAVPAYLKMEASPRTIHPKMGIFPKIYADKPILASVRPVISLGPKNKEGGKRPRKI